MMPTLPQPPPHQSPHLLPEAGPTSHARPRLLKLLVPSLQDHVHEIGKEVQIVKDCAQALLPMPKIMRQTVAMILLDVELLVLDLPLRQSDRDDLSNIPLSDELVSKVVEI
jgi:hypothetical protein